MALAVKSAAVAIPLTSVTAVVTLFVESANVPLAPLAGAVKVTVCPGAGLLRVSKTQACSGVGNVVFGSVF